jgi:hypothetical protein
MTGAQAAGRFTLVKDGNPACVIIISEKASENAAFAANELQQYVAKISGAKLPIYLDSQKIMHRDPLVLVGRSQYTDAMPSLQVPDGVTNAMREEGYIVKATPDTLVLAGNDTYPYYGTRYAVSDLLNRLGVRWFMPGDYGEVVPKSATLAVPALSILERPDFPLRAFWAHAQGNMAAERELWTIRNRMNMRIINSFGLPGDGSLIGYLPQEQLKDHPEWFALQPDGTRDANLLCMSDELRRDNPKYQGQPRVLDEILKKVGEDVRAGKPSSGLAPADGVPTCECDLCKRLSFRFAETLSPDPNGDPLPQYYTGQEWFFFVDKLLEAVGQQYPGHLIATNGYANRIVPPEAPPTFNRHKNLTVMYADIMSCTIHRYDDPKCWQIQRQYDMIRQWCKLSDKVWTYNYMEPLMVRKNTPVPLVHRVRANIPLLKQAGIIGFYDEDGDDMAVLGLPTYAVRMALEWNTRADVDAVLADFYAKWFGPAAAPMSDYYQALETAIESAPVHGHEDVIMPSIYTPRLIGRLERDILQAERLAKTDTEKLHVRVERLTFDHLHDYMLAEQAKRELRFADAAKLLAHMLALKKEQHAISPFYGWIPYPVYCEEWEKERMQRLAGLADGGLIPLPEAARFRTDSYNTGVFQRWMEPAVDDAKWQRCLTISGWQNQGLKDDDGRPLSSKDGHAYQGYGWYRFTVTVPAAPGKQTRLFCPAVVNQVWVWVNGQYAGRTPYMSPWGRPHELDMDITPFLKPDQPNLITLRVRCDEDFFGVNGLYEWPFIYLK